MPSVRSPGYLLVSSFVKQEDVISLSRLKQTERNLHSLTLIKLALLTQSLNSHTLLLMHIRLIKKKERSVIGSEKGFLYYSPYLENSCFKRVILKIIIWGAGKGRVGKEERSEQSTTLPL